jgi:hypothetical protein
MVMSLVQDAGQNNNIKIGCTSFDKLEKLRFLKRNLTNQNSIHEQIKSKLKSKTSCYHTVQNILFSSFLFKNVKSQIFTNVIFLQFCMDVKPVPSH